MAGLSLARPGCSAATKPDVPTSPGVPLLRSPCAAEREDGDAVTASTHGAAPAPSAAPAGAAFMLRPHGCDSRWQDARAKV
jgi:hypothetical protein